VESRLLSGFWTAITMRLRAGPAQESRAIRETRAGQMALARLTYAGAACA
jgi:hypothetical protein